ncbi:MAG: heparin-sulfate lyase HepC [Bacteroidaceae bacterium]
MKSLKYYFLFALVCCFGHLGAQELRTEVFNLLNLDYPGLEQVKALHNEGKDAEAAQALLTYYRQRTHVNHPDIKDPTKVTISKQEQKWADDGMEHTFFVHKGYQPSYNYGKDINWQYWPVRDNELRWQLHRHKWFTPMGKAYRVSGDEKYAKEWVYQYMDWIKKNPLVGVDKEEYEIVSSGEIKGDAENVRFAWRPLEVSNRLADQTGQFLLFKDSPHFTPEFLTEFLLNYYRHAIHLINNYSDQGNHLLFEAQRIMYAGAFFPEFKKAMEWRASGISVLNKEIDVQVYPDGGQFELDPHYHLAAINIFYKAIQMADANNFRNEFPQHYIDMVEKMIEFYLNIVFPDGSNPCFSDAKITGMKELVSDCKKWSKVFPKNDFIRYFATQGKKGALPNHLSQAYLNSGFFVFRSSWTEPATMMVVKAGPKAFWHCQPDNGTFELWMNGRNLFPDSGSYVYAGDDEVMKWRNWFRSTKVHNTLTLDNKTLETTESKTLLWEGEGDVQKLVTENPSYTDLKHRRSIFFVDNKFFVIVDEAVGTAKGDIDVHYQLCEGKVNLDPKNCALLSAFEGESNVALQCFGPKGTTLVEEEGWRSTAYRKKVERTAVAFHAPKTTNEAVRYITVIYPVNDGQMPAIKASFKNKKFDENGLNVQVKVGKQKFDLTYQLNR